VRSSPSAGVEVGSSRSSGGGSPERLTNRLHVNPLDERLDLSEVAQAPSWTRDHRRGDPLRRPRTACARPCSTSCRTPSRHRAGPRCAWAPSPTGRREPADPARRLRHQGRARAGAGPAGDRPLPRRGRRRPRPLPRARSARPVTAAVTWTLRGPTRTRWCTTVLTSSRTGGDTTMLPLLATSEPLLHRATDALQPGSAAAPEPRRRRGARGRRLRGAPGGEPHGRAGRPAEVVGPAGAAWRERELGLAPVRGG
jgi:hypothetical protein